MHWRNSNFGIRHFIANKCHTADEAYRVLCELYEDRDVAIKNAEAASLREKAKRTKAESILTSDAPEWEKMEAEAELIELDAFKKQGDDVLDAGIRERDYIQSLIAEIQPLRKYAHLPDHEAYQLAQEEEWKHELVWRAQNFLASQGNIPHDHLATMRLHPAWEDTLLPQIEHIIDLQKAGKGFLPMHTPVLSLEDKSNNDK